jgi:DNA mismatch repair protein MutS2
MSAPSLSDVNWKTAATDLGFAAVLDSIAACAITPRTAAGLRARAPLSQEAATQEQTWLSETLRLSERGQDLPLQATPECQPSLERLLRSAALSAEELRDLAQVLEQHRKLTAHLKEQREHCPSLTLAFSDPVPLSPFASELGRCLDEHGQILDLASAGLAAARRTHAELQNALRESLLELVAKYRSVLSGSYSAERNGRFVLPVRSDSAQAVDGSVLGTSGSGSTLYIEPRELFSANNRVYQAYARVEAEEARVLERLNEQARDVTSLLELAVANVDLADRLGAATLFPCVSLPSRA